jgi:hypothetical protein
MAEIDQRVDVLRALRSLVTERMNGLRERCQQRLQQLSSSPIPNPLYHYTDTRGFMGIVSKHELWASRIDFLNDASEIPYARGLMKERLKHFREKLNEAEEIRMLDWLEVSGPDFVRDYFKVYSISLSSKYDDLSQWRGYSGGLGGYSIGFDFTNVGLAVSIFEGRKALEPRMVEMVYDPDEQTNSLDDLIQQMLELLSSLRADTDPTLVRNLERFICQDILNLLADYFIRFKNPVFHEEEEWRLVVLGNVGEQVQYRESRFGLIPYVKYGERPLPITKVVQGPRVEPELSKEAVEGFLATHSYRSPGVEVCLSKVPLRY